MLSRFSNSAAQGQGDDETRALPWVVVSDNRTTVLRNDCPANCQPEPCSAGIALGGTALYERIENAFELIGRDANSLIDKADGQSGLQAAIVGTSAGRHFSIEQFNANCSAYRENLMALASRLQKT